MKSRALAFSLLLAGCFAPFSSSLLAQTNSIQLFGPVNVSQSQTAAGYTTPVTFNSNTLNLSCGESPTAVLSGSAAGTANVLVDNNIYVSNLTFPQGPSNVCQKGQVDTNNDIQYPDCFTMNYQTPAGAGFLTGADLDTYNNTTDGYLVNLSTAGVPPIDISGFLTSNQTQQIKIDLQDDGGYFASSSLYLVTNCTSNGVNGQAQISGNTIPASNPTTTQLDQDFTFDPTTKQMIGFEYDLTGAYSAQQQGTGTLTTDLNGANPQVFDLGLDPSAGFQSLVNGTSFATASCLVHDGELLNGLPACKLFTLKCTNGTDPNASGVNCPVSSAPNEVVKDVFDGPSFTLSDIPTDGPTFHQGMGFLMATDGWAGGQCVFDSTEPILAAEMCPQNLLTSFTGPGAFSSNGQTTHPNSTFVTIAGVPEDLTTITTTDSSGKPVTLGPENWTNNSSPYFTLSSQPPNLAGASVPNAGNFVPAPVKTITWGISNGTTPPAVGTTTATDTTLTNPAGCPAPGISGPATQPAFAPSTVEQLSNPGDGNYLIHYYATDCAGTQELLFLNTKPDGTGSWSTNFYTFPINIDTVAPAVATGPMLSPAGPYFQGQPVTATFSCTDNSEAVNSGVINCGGQSFPVGTTDTGTITLPVNTSASGTFSVIATDAAGNQSLPAQAPFVVNVDSQITLTDSPGTITYPLGTNLTVKVANIHGHVPTGTVQILDNGTLVASLSLSSGAAYYYLKGLPSGMHSLNAVYSGDKYNTAGTSASVVLNVQPVPVTLSVSCWNTPYPYGANFQCVITASSNAGAPLGSIFYAYDGGAPTPIVLASGKANLTITKPPVGSHSLVISFPAQTNYAASGPKTENFSVTPAPVIVQFTPSSWYLTGGNLTLTASVQSWSAGPPNSTGSVTFSRGSTVLAVVPVNTSGVAVSPMIPATSLPNGNDVLTATYSGGTNYATGSTNITVQLAHH